VPAGALSYLWSTGATTNCITVSTAGAYSVTVTYTGGCSSVCSATVIVNPLPVCTITGGLTICEGQSTQLCTPAGAASYLWSTGATTNCITVNAAGTYSVTVTGTNGCSSVCSKSVTVKPLPSCYISGNSSLCEGGSTSLCAPQGSGYTYLWSTGATTRCVTVNTAGTYFVTVTNSFGCSSICSKTVTVGTPPPCTITGNNIICEGQTTQLCAPAGLNDYWWSTGATSRCITVGAAGTYSITITDNSGCSSVCSVTVTVNPAPTCTITGNNIICEGQSTELCTPFATGNTYLWSTGATANCITVSAAGTYSVTVTGTNGCSSVCSKSVTVKPLPICTITGNSTICEGQSTQLCAYKGGGYTYLWSTGVTTKCVTVSTAGTYSVTVTNSFGCSSICSKTVTVGTPPPCTITGNGTICEGQSTQLCAPTGSGYTYSWDTGASTNCIIVDGQGTYHVTVTDANGCSSTCSKVVTVIPRPACTITGGGTICEGGSTSICVLLVAGNTYLWSNGATTNCITVSIAGTYSVTITNSNGCSKTCSKTVTVKSAPPCTITGNSTVCEGESISLCAPQGSGYTYLWNTGATSRCITVSYAGVFTVTVSKNGCSSTCSKTVTLNPEPSCTITGELNPSEGDLTTLCAPPGLSSYHWSTGATTSCITVNCSGTYGVTVTNSTGCSGSCNVSVTYNPGRSAPDEDNGLTIAGDIEVKVYPNPFSTSATVEFQTTQSNSHIVITLYNLTGDQVATIFDGDVERGVWHKAEINAGNLPPGAYIYRVVNGDRIINRKITLLK